MGQTYDILQAAYQFISTILECRIDGPVLTLPCVMLPICRLDNQQACENMPEGLTLIIFSHETIFLQALDAAQGKFGGQCA
jgi:hypothetical protein